MATIFSETLHKGYGQHMEVAGDMLVNQRSEFQHIQIFDTEALGRVMTLDGVVQITERDEASYSEMLTHLPMVEHGAVKRVMIVGGGDGAIAEECLKHPGVEVDMCEIDGMVVDYCKQYFASVNKGVFDDPRFNLFVADAFEHLKAADSKGKYDLIIADRPDPLGPAQVLFATEFYELIRDALTDTGIAVFQNGCPFFQADELTGTMRQLRGVFPHAGTYLTVTPTYIGGFMALTWGSKGTNLGSLSVEDAAKRVEQIQLSTDYYTPAIHAGAFALPAWIERLV
ncbi:polyamine aminopropyltransferase [Caenispirillum salinarum]|uniref:polyamine aminopropyltransferase n=1 Tax=Caenispirillum salinarum TaxID=859058 RepID=UPI0038500FF4